MYYVIEEPKAIFGYTLNGVEHSRYDQEYFDELGLDANAISQVQHLRLVYENQLLHFEREWRNRQLTNTDWLMVPDATFGGEPLAGSSKYEDIRLYRDALRNYDFINEDRPEMPDWLKPEGA